MAASRAAGEKVDLAARIAVASEEKATVKADLHSSLH